jgi:hypothetical protein
MISASRPYNTAVVRDEKEKIYYCAYCQSVALESTEIDHRDIYTYRNCDCPDAEIERSIVMYRAPQRPLVDYQFTRDMEYKNKLYKLNREYEK